MEGSKKQGGGLKNSGPLKSIRANYRHLFKLGTEPGRAGSRNFPAVSHMIDFRRLKKWWPPVVFHFETALNPYFQHFCRANHHHHHRRHHHHHRGFPRPSVETLALFVTKVVDPRPTQYKPQRKRRAVWSKRSLWKGWSCGCWHVGWYNMDW